MNITKTYRNQTICKNLKLTEKINLQLKTNQVLKQKMIIYLHYKNLKIRLLFKSRIKGQLKLIKKKIMKLKKKIALICFLNQDK